MVEDSWVTRVTYNGKKLTVKERILLYLYTLDSYENANEIPTRGRPAERTEKFIKKIVSLKETDSNVNKALRELSDTKDEKPLLVKAAYLAPNVKCGRYANYYALNRNGANRARSLLENVNFDIRQQPIGEEERIIGYLGKLEDIVKQNGKIGEKIDDKEVLKEIINNGYYKVKDIEELLLVKRLKPVKFSYPIDVVRHALNRMVLLADILERTLNNIRIVRDGNRYRIYAELPDGMREVIITGKQCGPATMVYEYETFHEGERYTGSAEITIEEKTPEECRLTIKTYGGNKEIAQKLKKMKLITGLIDDYIVESLKLACSIIEKEFTHYQHPSNGNKNLEMRLKAKLR